MHFLVAKRLIKKSFAQRGDQIILARQKKAKLSGPDQLRSREKGAPLSQRAKML